MAARLNNRHQQMVRDKIQASQLINRLQDHVDGKVELTAAQVNSAKILLDRSLPVLQSVEHTTDGDGGFVVKLVSQVSGTVPADD